MVIFTASELHLSQGTNSVWLGRGYKSQQQRLYFSGNKIVVISSFGRLFFLFRMTSLTSHLVCMIQDMCTLRSFDEELLALEDPFQRSANCKGDDPVRWRSYGTIKGVEGSARHEQQTLNIYGSSL